MGAPGLLPEHLRPGTLQVPGIGAEEASGSLRMELQTPNCPQCPAWGESLVPGARAGSVAVHQVSLRVAAALGWWG